MALAEILREDETMVPGPRATSPAPGLPADVLGLEVPPLVSDGAPPQPVPAVFPGTTQMSSIAEQLMGPGGTRAQMVDAARAKGEAMGPVIDTVSAALDSPRPARPAVPEITAPPSRGLRPFLSTSPDEPPETSIQKLIMATGLFAMGLGGGQGAAKASLASLTGAIAGWQAGDRERADRAFLDWQAQNDRALTQWKLQSQDYDNALKDRGLDLDGRLQQLKLVALKHDNVIAVGEMESKGLEGALAYLTTERNHADTLEKEAAALKLAYAKAAVEGTKQDTMTFGDTQYRMTYDAAGNEVKRTYAGPKPAGQGTEAERFAKAEMAWRLAPTTDTKEKYDEAKLAFENAERLAGVKASAAAIGEIQAKRGVAMTPKETENLLHPQRLTGPPPGTTTDQVIAQGYVDVDEKDRAIVADLQSTKALVGTLTAMTQRLITAKNPSDAARQAASLEFGARTGSNALARTYAEEKDAFLGTISRSLGGERGVLTDKDIGRVARSLPAFFDTRQVADAKEGMLDLLIDTAYRARVAKMTKQPFDEAASKARIDSIIGKLETTAAPKPGEPGSPWKAR